MNSKTISLFCPFIGHEECRAVQEVLLSGWTGLGPKTHEFELSLAQYVRMPYAVAVNSCTAALDLALQLINVGPGDEVLVPAMTFVSTAHVVVYNGATPVFCDIDPDTLLIDLTDLQKKITPKTKAVIPVHYAGRCVDIQRLRKLIGSQIFIIEDCAHAMGSWKNKQHAGSWGDIACFSFQAVKNLSAGDGGALVVRNNEWAQRAFKLRWLGIDKGTWDRSSIDKKYWWEYTVEEIGLKCHMNDITAAIAVEQLKKLDKMNARRKEIERLYRLGLSSVRPVKLPPPINSVRSSWHIFSIQIEDRDHLAVYLADMGISTGVHYKPIHLYRCYGNDPVSLPVAETVWTKLLSLPMHPGLTDGDVEYIIAHIQKFYAKQ